jgi:hypothetical protein
LIFPTTGHEVDWPLDLAIISKIWLFCKGKLKKWSK